MRSISTTLPLLALTLGLALATAATRSELAPEAAGLGKVRDPSWLPDGKVVRLVSFGQRLLVSDLYWLQTVQYMGEGFDEPRRGWEALRPLVEIVTDLDPRHGYAYQMSALCLADQAHRLVDAYAVLDKGMDAVPERWSLPLLYGQLKFMNEQDFVAAAEYVRRASVVGRRPSLALLAATLAMKTNEADEYRVSIALLEEMIPLTGEPTLKADLETRLVRVRTYEALSAVERAITRFRGTKRRLPARLDELVADGLLPSVPADPAGGRIRYHPADGTVESTVLGSRKPFP